MNDRLKYIRKRERLSQEKMAQILGVTRACLANYESGRNNPTNPFINLFCIEFNINKEWFVTGNGEPYNKPEFDDGYIASLFADLTLGKNEELKKLLYKVSKIDKSYYSSIETLIDGLLK